MMFINVMLIGYNKKPEQDIQKLKQDNQSKAEEIKALQAALAVLRARGCKLFFLEVRLFIIV